jgi:RNA polymerase sigma-70 factor (ECF subfamily)
MSGNFGDGTGRRVNDALFESWVRAHATELYRAAYRKLGNPKDAEDCVQEACSRAWRALPRSGDIENPRAWLHRIVLNTALNMLRRKRRDAFPFDQLEIHIAGHEEDVDRRVDVARVLAALPEHLRELIELRYWAGFTDAEIADIVGVPPGTVKSQLHRARMQMHGALGELVGS